MRLHAVRLAAAVVLFACVNASSLKSQPYSALSDQENERSPRNDTNEERGPITPGTTSLAKRVQSKIALELKLLTKSPRSAFTYLKLNQAGEDLLYRSRFLQWYQHVQKKIKSNPESEALQILASNFDDLTLTKMLIAFKKADDTREIATKLQDEQIHAWYIGKKELDTLFKELKLDVNNDGLLQDSVYNVWYRLAQKKHSDMHNGPEHYAMSVSDTYMNPLQLIQMLIAAPKDAQELSSTLQSLLFNIWSMKFKTADTLFKELELNPAKDNIFHDPIYKVWHKYARKMSSSDLDMQVARVLSSDSNDENFFNMLIALRNADSTKDSASQLLNGLMRVWGERKKPVEEVFELLKIDPASNDLFHNGPFNLYFKHAQSVNKDTDAAVAEFLSTHLGNLGLIKMLQAAVEVESTKDIASRLQKGLVKAWKHLSVEEVFKRLEIDPASNDLFHNGLFNLWYKHAHSVVKDLDAAIAEFLSTRLDEKKLIMMITAAREFDDTKGIASELQNRKNDTWTRKQVHPGELYKQLEVYLTNDVLFRDPVFNIWYEYVKKWTRFPNTEAADSLSVHFGDMEFVKMLIAAMKFDDTKEIATKLQKGLFEVWRDREEHPGELLVRLEFYLTSDVLFRDPFFKIWRTYVNNWTTYSPKKAAETLSAHFGEMKLIEMLAAAMKFDDTKAIATEIQEGLIEAWKSYRLSSAGLLKRLEIDSKFADQLNSPFFDIWCKYVKSYGFSIGQVFERLEIDPESADLLREPFFVLWYEYVKKVEKLPGTAAATYLMKLLGEAKFTMQVRGASVAEDTKTIASMLLLGQEIARFIKIEV